MKLSKLPKRTRTRIFKLATRHLIDVEQVIGIAVDLLYAALEDGSFNVPTQPAKKTPTSVTSPTSIGDILHAGTTETPRHNSRSGR